MMKTNDESARSELAMMLGLKRGETPFPWQERLSNDWFKRGRIPRALDIPTGLGKTSVMAVWLSARASGASVPRRLVYIVDRRAVVDQATEEAERLRALVDAQPKVKEALGLHGSLPISTLRGQHVDNREWLEDPSSVAIIVGTVDMIGSRLLFEGYRCSRKMRPYHAALLGVDALIVLDEAHLVPPFERLLDAITAKAGAFGPSSDLDRSVVPAAHLMSLSATGSETVGALELDALDLEHRVVRKRIEARKRLHIVEPIDPEETMLSEVLAAHALNLCERAERPIRCIVFCDKREDAQDVSEGLRSGASERSIDIEEPQLFVGGRRVHERADAAAWLKTHSYVAGDEIAPPRHTFVVATSAGEVGVDLDAEHMVGDLVAWERMVQRLGRVNRRGNGSAEVVVVPSGPDAKTRAALEKQARIDSRKPAQIDDTAGEIEDADDEADETAVLKSTDRDLVRRHILARESLRALRALPSEDGVYDASPAAINALKKRDPALVRSASTPAPLHPTLTRAVLESWSMTSLRDHTGRPEVAPWLRGWIEEDAQCTILWRRHLPVRADGTVPKREAVAFFEAAAPHTSELLEAELNRVVDWLIARIKTVAKAARAAMVLDEDVEGTRSKASSEQENAGPLRLGDIVAIVLARPDEVGRCYRVQELERADKDDLRSELNGRTLVVDVRLGGLTQGLLDKSSDDSSDVGELSALPFRVETTADTERRPREGWREELRLVLDRDAEERPSRWLIVDTDRSHPANLEDARSTGRAQLLDEHQRCTEQRARKLAARLGLETTYVSALALAARLHDEGKRSPRWQQAFKAPSAEAWGKTINRPNIALLDGYRHELGSIPRAERDPRVVDLDPARRDLVLHLIASHHGWARPIIPTTGCDDAPPIALASRAREIALRFTRLEQQWGPWGLAWWEALLRAADQQASRDNDRGGDCG